MSLKDQTGLPVFGLSPGLLGAVDGSPGLWHARTARFQLNAIFSSRLQMTPFPLEAQKTRQNDLGT